MTRRFLLWAALAGSLALAAASPAQAAVFEHGTFSFEESVDEDLCGIAAHRDTTVTGKFRTRTGKGDLDQAFFGQALIDSTDTFTNLATGASFSIEGSFIGKDVKATPLGGNLFEFSGLEAGTVTVRDMDGNVVLSDSGAIWRTFVFDTFGDSMPGGDVLDETVDRVSGAHPFFEMDEAAFCDMVHDLIG